MTRSLALLLPLALLAACNKPAENDQRSASGEVLEGTISDAMLPVDKLRSQGPMLAPRKAGGAAEDVEDQASGEDATEGEATAQDESVPAAAPSSGP